MVLVFSALTALTDSVLHFGAALTFKKIRLVCWNILFMLHINVWTELLSSPSWWLVFMTLTENHFYNWTFPDHELAKLILKIHMLLITAPIKLEWIQQSQEGCFVLIAVIRNRKNSNVPKRPQYFSEMFPPASDCSIQLYQPSSLSWRVMNGLIGSSTASVTQKVSSEREATGTKSPV